LDKQTTIEASAVTKGKWNVLYDGCRQKQLCTVKAENSNQYLLH